MQTTPDCKKSSRSNSASTNQDTSKSKLNMWSSFPREFLLKHCNITCFLVYIHRQHASSSFSLLKLRILFSIVCSTIKSLNNRKQFPWRDDLQTLQTKEKILTEVRGIPLYFLLFSIPLWPICSFFATFLYCPTYY